MIAPCYIQGNTGSWLFYDLKNVAHPQEPVVSNVLVTC